MYELGIMNGNVYLNGSFIKTNIYVKDGRVAALSTDKFECNKYDDVNGRKVLPGFIDPHVHFSLTVGENTSTDDFESGSVNGLLGGVTTYIDFLDPVKTKNELKKAFDDRMKLAENSASDYAFHSCLANPSDSAKDMIKESLKCGITSIKLFTTYSNTDRRTYDDYIFELLKLSKMYNTRIVIHSENDDLVDYSKEILIKDHEKSRDTLCETTEVLKLAQMARISRGNLYIVHVSAGTTADIISREYSKELKEGGIIMESCPHYFIMNSDFYKKKNGYLYTMTPPLRPEDDRVLLCAHIDEISTIGTDHCPFTAKMKEHKYTSETPMGIGGIKYSFLNMYTDFGEKVIDKFTVNPAKAYNMYPRKGTLLVGADADIVIFDDAVEGPIKDKESLYNGRTVKGKIDRVYLGGTLAVGEGKYLGSKGKYIKR
ncbi:MAG: amidohydrolase family protein [Candidatus Metalachnospira sp.]|nr:amidohydrolase family protein [Candidatus Metalachnospira sp.]